MDKLLDLFLTTPFARRVIAGHVERALLSACMFAAGYVHLQAGTYESQAAKMAADAAPILVALLFAWIAQKRIRKTEVTIEVARTAVAELPRATIDAAVNAMTKAETSQVLGQAKADATASRLNVEGA